MKYEEWLQGAERGKLGGGWFIHGAQDHSASRLGVVLGVAATEMRDSFV